MTNSQQPLKLDLEATAEPRVILRERSDIDWKGRLKSVHDFQRNHDGWGRANSRELYRELKSLQNVFKNGEPGKTQKVLEGSRYFQKIFRGRLDANRNTERITGRKVSNTIPIPTPLAFLILGASYASQLDSSMAIELETLFLEMNFSKRWPTYNKERWVRNSGQELPSWLSELKRDMKRRLRKSPDFPELMKIVLGLAMRGGAIAEAILPSNQQIKDLDDTSLQNLAVLTLFLNQEQFDHYRSIVFSKKRGPNTIPP